VRGMTDKKVTTATLQEMKKRGEKITMLTAYDYTMAKLVDEAGIDMILVGDSLGMVVLGYDTTLPVKMEDMIHHTTAVVRGRKRALVVADMPFLSYEVSVEEAVRNAGRLVQDAGAEAVKLEGGKEVANAIEAIVNAGIPVVGHLGLTPQSVNKFGGFKVQGKNEAAARQLIQDAKILTEAGAFSIVLECIPWAIAKMITDEVPIPVIGIGAGPYCDGQVLVFHDIVGLYDKFVPKFVKQYAQVGQVIRDACSQFANEVRQGRFPAEEHGFKIDQEELNKLRS
jgi:3-methyl-2-oxobutanoate hydroxymethyltransferase